MTAAEQHLAAYVDELAARHGVHVAWERMAKTAFFSLTATAASQPAIRTGHARLETVPQLSPAITVAAVGTVTGRPTPT